MTQPSTAQSSSTAPANADARALAHAQAVQDQEALPLLKRGQWSAMEGLVLRYQDRLFATVFRLVNHPEDAADIVQETFVKAMQNISGFEGKSSLYTWLFRIAVNQSLSFRRAKVYRTTQSLDGFDDEHTNHQADNLRRQLAQSTEADPSTNADVRMEHTRALAALQTLDAQTRTLIILRDIENLDYDQIADILEVPTGTVKSRLFRARQQLRIALTPKAK